MKIIYKIPFVMFSVFLFLPVLTQAASVFDISYPIADLGNCATQAECKLYCDVPQNADTCALWAENMGIIPKRQTSMKPAGTPPSDGNIEGERPAPNREQELEMKKLLQMILGDVKRHENVMHIVVWKKIWVNVWITALNMDT